MLCDVCSLFSDHVLNGNLHGERWRPGRYPAQRDFLHETLEQVGHNADRGCGICSILHDHYTPLRPDLQVLVSVNMPYYEYDRGYTWQIFLHRALPFDPKSQQRQSLYPPGPSPPPVPDMFEFCFFDPNKNQPLDNVTGSRFNVVSEVEQHIGTAVEEYSGSSATAELVKLWSSQCNSNHADCLGRRTRKPLPPRVLDLGEIRADGTWSQPRLVLSEGRDGYYATLSYRWSQIGTQFCTTASNYEDIINFLPIWKLPRTIQDAIAFCRRIGWRYLWVDSLCIIQGDATDWDDACQRMADIYENCQLNISALRSANSHAGLCHYRNADLLTNRACLRLHDGRFLTLRRTSYLLTLNAEAARSPMSRRGWILQERLLSPAIVHFASAGLHWECRGGTMSERNPYRTLPGHGLLKNTLFAFQPPLSINRPGGHFVAWYIIIGEYSRMDLSLPSDRLPAILGLATRFQSWFHTTFVAGLWLEDLHRGLLWKTSHTSTGRRPPNQNRSSDSDEASGSTMPDDVEPSIEAPSWSWLWRAGPCRINVEIPLGDRPLLGVHEGYPAQRIESGADALIISANLNPRSGIHLNTIQGTIELWGIATHVKPQTSYIDKTCSWKCHITKPTSTSTFMRPKSQYHRRRKTSMNVFKSVRDTDNGIELPCFLDRQEIDITEEFYCLVIADWHFELSRKEMPLGMDASAANPRELRCYLLLRRVHPLRSNQHPNDLGVFQRVAVGAAAIHLVDKFFGTANTTRRYMKII